MNYRRYDERPATLLSESAQRFLQDSPSREYTILCGRNNSGKSYLLKTLQSNSVRAHLILAGQISELRHAKLICSKSQYQEKNRKVSTVSKPMEE